MTGSSSSSATTSLQLNSIVAFDDNQINNDNNNDDDDDNENHISVITFPDLTTLLCDLIIKKHSKIHEVDIYAGRNYKRGEVVERCISVSICKYVYISLFIIIAITILYGSSLLKCRVLA